MEIVRLVEREVLPRSIVLRLCSSWGMFKRHLLNLILCYSYFDGGYSEVSFLLSPWLSDDDMNVYPLEYGSNNSLNKIYSFHNLRMALGQYSLRDKPTPKPTPIDHLLSRWRAPSVSSIHPSIHHHLRLSVAIFSRRLPHKRGVERSWGLGCAGVRLGGVTSRNKPQIESFSLHQLFLTPSKLLLVSIHTQIVQKG